MSKEQEKKKKEPDTAENPSRQKNSGTNKPPVLKSGSDSGESIARSGTILASDVGPRSDKCGLAPSTPAKPTKQEADKLYSRMRRLGAKVNSTSDPQFPALQKHWYDKLASGGFKDLEWVDHKTGRGQNSDHLRDSLGSIRKAYNPDVENHFRLCRNYLSNASIRPAWRKEIFELYVEGVSYRAIRKILLDRNSPGPAGKPTSHATIFRVVKEMKLEMETWNIHSPKGMLNPSNQDVWFEDLVLPKSIGRRKP